MRRRGWLPVAVGIGIGMNTVRLRARLHAIEVIEAGEETATDAPGTGPNSSSYVLLSVSGMPLTAAQRRAAEAHAHRHGLEVLDLVPAELAAHRVLDLARMVEPATYRAARLARGRGAFQAVLVDREVLARTRLPAADDPRLAERSELTDFTDAELVAVVQVCKRHAATTTDLAVLPGLTGGGPDDGATRLPVQRAAYAWEPARRILPALRDGAILLGAASNPPATLAALGLSWLQPVIVGGDRVRVTSGTLRHSALTRRRVAAAQVRGAGGRVRELLGAPAVAPDVPGGRRRPPPPPGRPSPAEIARQRAGYRADLAGGLDRFFERPRTTCPWCGGGELAARLRGRDVAQGKPGEFRYDRCAGCGHVFQNPRLSLDGLDFYYRDFYDGLGATALEEVFGFSPEPYLDRARQAIPTPRNWLDVGGGHGHFCNVARTVWPATRFDALDIGAGIEEAARRRWVDRAYRGFFPELAAEVKGRYDIISMFHYLEHTRDPLAELDAAAAVLQPGGHLLIEVPNPDSPAARLYGPLWPGWLIPQHQHLMPAANVAVALQERGFAVQETRFGEVHQKGDPVMALYGLLQRLAPSPSAAWRTAALPGRARAVRALTAAALVPAFAAGLVLDEVSRPYLTSGSRANAYRILARRL
nr:class I SAM-dependent methyltransferase [Frankia sp. QA3]